MADPSQNICSYLRRRWQDNKYTQPALYFAGRYVSYRRFFECVEKCAAALSACGLKKGNCITVALPNVPSAVYLLYGAASLGVVVDLVHPAVPYAQLAAYSEATDSKMLFVFDVAANRYADRLKTDGRQVVVCGAQDDLTSFERFFYKWYIAKKRSAVRKGFVSFRHFLAAGVNSAPVDVAGDDVAVIMHSSGTTGQPKSVALSHKAINIQSAAIIEAISNHKEKDGKNAMLAVLPMFHAFGLCVCLHCVLANGITSVLVPKYSAKTIVRYIRRGKVTLLAGVPTMYRGIVAQKGFDCKNAGKLISAFCGGDVADEALRKQFDSVMRKRGSVCRLNVGYGMTESGGVFSANKFGDDKAGSNGKPLRDDFVAEAFSGDEMLPRGEKGTLCLSTPSVMTGYLRDEAATSACLFSYGGKTWIRSGDVGFVDEEGFLHFLGREKRVVKVSGVNVFPEQVENVIAQLPCVAGVAVKEVPDVKKGHVLAAYVAVRGEKEDAGKAIRAFCGEKLDKWSCPRQIVFVDALPTTATGKLDYAKLP